MKRPAKRKPKRATPRIKKLKLSEADVLEVKVHPKMIPAIIPGPVPNVMRIAALPADKPWPSRVMDYLFGVEKK